MNIRFEKVSFEQFYEDTLPLLELDEILTEEATRQSIKEIYDSIKLPTRGTEGSAGYDFYFPFYNLNVDPNVCELIPTGIRAVMDPGVVLLLFPRSGLGFKTGVKLANTTGVIDSDYSHAKNEGHIMVKLLGGYSRMSLDHNDRFIQGIFVPYYTIDDDKVLNSDRTGGFGSTGVK